MSNFPPPPPLPLSTALFDEFSDLTTSDEKSDDSLSETIEVKNLIINPEDKQNTDYLCPICREFMLPDECIELNCGHLFCKNCISSINNNLSLTAKCPLCNESSTTFKYIKNNNKFAYKILCNIKIKCPNNECNEELYAGNLKDHLKKCEYAFVDCLYCDKKNIFRKDLKKHLTENMEDHFLKLMDEIDYLKKKVDKMSKFD